MDFTQIIQTGGTVSTIVIMWLMLKYFMEAIKKKDEQIAVSHKDFLLVISNHLKHQESAFKELADAIKDLRK